MTTIKLSPKQVELLKISATPRGLDCYKWKKQIQPMVKMGFMTEEVGYFYDITPAGLAYLYQDAPMVDQPQPASEVKKLKAGDFVDYVDVNNRQQRGQITKAGDVTLIIVTSMGRKIVRHTDEVTLVK